MSKSVRGLRDGRGGDPRDGEDDPPEAVASEESLRSSLDELADRAERILSLTRELAVAREAERHALLEVGRLQGISLMSRELAHLVNNALSLPTALLDLLVGDEDSLPPSIRALLPKAAADLERAVGYVEQIQRVVRIETKETPVGRVLDLDRSTEEPSDGVS